MTNISSGGSKGRSEGEVNKIWKEDEKGVKNMATGGSKGRSQGEENKVPSRRSKGRSE